MRVSANTDIYIGRTAGKDLLNSIKGAKKYVKVVSPYLTPSFVEKLIKLHNKGVDITLVTANNLEEGDGRYSNLSHKHLIKQETIVDKEIQKKKSRAFNWFLGSAVLSAIVLLVQGFPPRLLSLPFIIPAILSTVMFIKYKNLNPISFKYFPLFRLKIVHGRYHEDQPGTHLVHSKIYVIDDKVAFLGSINFTYSGIVNSYESSVKVISEKAVGDISKEVDRLYNDKKLTSTSIDAWGKALYE